MKPKAPAPPTMLAPAYLEGKIEAGMYKVPYPPAPPPRGKNIKLWKGGREYIILRLLGRISSWEEGKGTEIFGKKIKILKNGVGEEYQCVGNFIHPWLEEVKNDEEAEKPVKAPTVHKRKKTKIEKAFNAKLGKIIN